jgi:hypothetical protein
MTYFLFLLILNPCLKKEGLLDCVITQHKDAGQNVSKIIEGTHGNVLWRMVRFAV